ncbi:phosphoethanolamine transferase [Legionella fallonii]|uniref:Putative sulfatase n=1 Tax=Legionella fallonii LLAP-10 TaxID=1212491 RepID=A0A098G0P2_9GAMM|nr:phosphoethanolamine--lipid A transferase [Legionella fallonii]CEG55534.1 putative sulfatase [Legionella fallonii LLAP-10]
MISSIFFVLFCSYSFWYKIALLKDLSAVHTWLIFLYLATAIIGLQWLLLLLVINRWTYRWLMPLLFLITSLAVYFISTLHIYIDPSMVVNVLNTDQQESKEFLQWGIAPYFLFLGALPSWIVWQVKIIPSRFSYRISMICLSLCMILGGVWACVYDFGPIIREQRHLLYLCTPLNVIYSSIKTCWKTRQISKDKIKIGEDAYQGYRTAASKPRIIILVIGETVRASNWGLNNYIRQTTPALAQHKLINFSQVTSCGTNTAISVPCMFSPYGMHSNQQLIQNSESLLHVLNKAKITVLWRDNQSGCQGVCNGLPVEKVTVDALCKHGRCLDEVLLHQLKERIQAQKNDQIIVLHMLGNHGPAYFERYPEQFKRWQPICETTDLSRCSQKSIINTYDNAILYTDSILANAIDLLTTIESHDTGLIYLSDHGESLGEHGLFLHGLPYFLAPDEQKKVPMVLWLSQGLLRQLRIQKNCLHKKQADPISHDYLFSTILGLLEVKTNVYKEELDLTASCRALS